MKEYIGEVKKQMAPIITAALFAALLAFGQSLAAGSGLCPLPAANPADAGAIGAIIKGMHTAFMYINFRHIA